MTTLGTKSHGGTNHFLPLLRDIALVEPSVALDGFVGILEIFSNVWFAKFSKVTKNVRHVCLVATCWVDRRGLPGVSIPGTTGDLLFVFLYTGGVGWGWVGGDNTKPVSRYATWSSLALDATLHDPHLHLTLRYMIFSCTWCCATWSSLALDATRTWSSLALDGTLLGWVGLGGWGRDNTKPVSRYATWSSIWLYGDTCLSQPYKQTKFALEGHAQTKIMQISFFSTPKNYKNASVFACLRQIWRKNIAQFADDEVAYLLLLLTSITIKSVKNIQKHCKKP